jgi:hypothetical protein
MKTLALTVYLTAFAITSARADWHTSLDVIGPGDHIVRAERIPSYGFSTEEWIEISSDAVSRLSVDDSPSFREILDSIRYCATVKYGRDCETSGKPCSSEEAVAYASTRCGLIIPSQKRPLKILQSGLEMRGDEPDLFVNEKTLFSANRVTNSSSYGELVAGSSTAPGSRFTRLCFPFGVSIEVPGMSGPAAWCAGS